MDGVDIVDLRLVVDTTQAVEADTIPLPRLADTTTTTSDGV